MAGQKASRFGTTALLRKTVAVIARLFPLPRVSPACGNAASVPQLGGDCAEL